MCRPCVVRDKRVWSNHYVLHHHTLTNESETMCHPCVIRDKRVWSNRFANESETITLSCFTTSKMSLISWSFPRLGHFGHTDDTAMLRSHATRHNGLDSLMGWLTLKGSFKLLVSFAEYSLFYRALFQKRPIILSSLLIVVAPYPWARELQTCLHNDWFRLVCHGRHTDDTRTTHNLRLICEWVIMQDMIIASASKHSLRELQTRLLQTPLPNDCFRLICCGRHTDNTRLFGIAVWSKTEWL